MKMFARPIAMAIVMLSALSTQAAFGQQAVLYDFTATWCGPCQQMSPIVHKLQREGFPVKQVDIDKNPNLARQFQISSIPAFVLVVDGKEVSREIGRTSEHQLRRMLASIPKPSKNPRGAIVRNDSNGPRSAQPQLGQAAPFPSIEASTEPASIANSRPPFNDASQTSLAAQMNQNLGTRDSGTVIRAQFDERNNVTKPTPHVDSQAANVRIRIRDDKGINYGSGTVVESRPGITYILTCGHIFRSLSQNSKVDIDIFVDDRYESFVGKVEKYDLDADVGLVSLPTDGVLPVARLATTPTLLEQGDQVVSVGCSGGQPPTVENLKVTALNRYTGPDNIECTGVPVQGRSGGGLFNQDNEIVGVCIAADPKEKRGLYAGLNPIVELLKSCGLSEIIRRDTPEREPEFWADSSTPNESDSTPFPQTAPTATKPVSETPVVTTTPAVNSAQQQQMSQVLNSAQGAKLTIIIEKPGAPGETQVVIIPAASSTLLAELTGELQGPAPVIANRPSETQPSETRSPFESASRQPTRTPVIEDRSQTMPTEYSAAQPYRRVKN